MFNHKVSVNSEVHDVSEVEGSPSSHNIMRMVPIRLPIVLLSEILGLQSWFSSLPQVTTSKAGREKRKQNTVEVFESKCLES